MTPSQNDPRKNNIDIDVTPLVWMQIGDLYRAICRVPCGTSGFDLIATAVRFVASRLALDAELHAAGVHLIRPNMNPAHALERSRDLLEMLERLEHRKAKGD